MTPAALLVEDNSSHVILIRDELAPLLEGWTVEAVATVREARRCMADRRWDLYVLDYPLPDGDGLTLLRDIRATDVAVPTLFITTAASARIAVEAMKHGADDYIVKEE